MPERRVLCVSFDMTVSDSRRAALTEAGYAVRATNRIKEGLDWLSREKFELVIIGHRFSTEDKYVLAVEAREKANTPVLLVCGASADAEIPATVRVYALEGTEGLLAAIARLLPATAAGAPGEAA
jgi:DNA-binding response OmpR family regulator